MRAKNGGMEFNYVKPMKSLEEENSHLKEVYVELSLLYQALSTALQLIFKNSEFLELRKLTRANIFDSRAVMSDFRITVRGLVEV